MRKKHLAVKSVSMLGLVLLVLLGGCSGNSVSTVPATGVLKINGKTVTDASGTIEFYPTGGGRTANASLELDGSFTVSYLKPGDGLPPGNYKVAFNIGKAKSNGGDESVVSGEAAKNLFPIEYGDIQTTPQLYEVVESEGPQFIDLDVKTRR